MGGGKNNTSSRCKKRKGKANKPWTIAPFRNIGYSILCKLFSVCSCGGVVNKCWEKKKKYNEGERTKDWQHIVIIKQEKKEREREQRCRRGFSKQLDCIYAAACCLLPRAKEAVSNI
jgi:hypothetical protein